MFDIERIHIFEVLGKKFVYDIRTCNAFEIDDLSYDILNISDVLTGDEIVTRLSTTYGRKNVELALSELVMLSDEGDLFSKEESATPDSDDMLNFLTLHVTRSCNLRCKYCFQGHEDHGTKIPPMSCDVGKRAVDLLIKESNGRKGLTLAFSGGEPLLHYDLIKYLVKYVKSREIEFEKRFYFQITTNGVLLGKEIIEFLDDNDFRVDISIDGSRDMHNKVRTFPGEEGSFDVVIRNALRLLELPIWKKTTIQAVLTSGNLNIFEELPSLFNLGFPRIAVNPVIFPSGDDLSIRTCDLVKAESYYDTFVKYYTQLLRKGVYPQFTNLIGTIRMLHSGKIRTHMCGAGVKRIIVAPDGYIYPCHILDGAEEHKMGSVFTGLDEKKRKAWVLSRDINTDEECRKCWARYLCGGGCRAIGYCLEGKLYQPLSPFCEYRKMDIERAIYVYSELDQGSINRLLA